MAFKDTFIIKEASGKAAGIPNELYRIMSELKNAGVISPGAEGTIFSALMDAWSWGKFGRRMPEPKSSGGGIPF